MGMDSVKNSKSSVMHYYQHLTCLLQVQAEANGKRRPTRPPRLVRSLEIKAHKVQPISELLGLRPVPHLPVEVPRSVGAAAANCHDLGFAEPISCMSVYLKH